jgi:Leucine-rich repeat (LRR) protein
MSYIEYQKIDGKFNRVNYDDHVEEIDLSCMQIERIISTKGLPDLRKLLLMDNQIGKIEGLDQLVNLQELSLSGNRISKIEGLDRLIDLRILYLSYNHISKIEGIDRLIDLRILYLSHNRISKIEGIDRLIDLQELSLAGNQITRIECLESLTNLQVLSLAGNRISKIEGLDQLIDLRILYLSYTQISKIEGIDRLIDLQELSLAGNQITRIECLESLTNLQVLSLYCNQIFKIEGLDRSANLHQLNLSINQITKIEGLDRSINLQQLELHNNPIKNVPLTIMRLRNLSELTVDGPINPLIERMIARNRIKSDKTIYTDKQNVHDSQINRQITDSLYRLMEQKNVMTEEMVMQEIIGDPVLTKQVKEAMVEYAKIPDVHSLINCTFMEALQAVWQTIQSHKNSVEIKKILDQEMQDSICRCFTGRLSRLVNSLNGFDDRVVVRISDSQEIANIIIAIRQKTDDLEQQIVLAKKELSDRGYDKNTIDEWLVYLE